jgi:hypothetical protein
MLRCVVWCGVVLLCGDVVVVAVVMVWRQCGVVVWCYGGNVWNRCGGVVWYI